MASVLEFMATCVLRHTPDSDWFEHDLNYRNGEHSCSVLP